MNAKTGDMSIASDSVRWFGGKAESGFHRDQWLTVLHEDDKDRLRTSLDKALSGEDFSTRYRLADASEEWIWVEAVLAANEESGELELFGLVGALPSTVEPRGRVAANDPRTLAAALRPTLYLARLDRDERYRWVNTAYAARLGLEPGALVGRSLSEVIGAGNYARFRPHLGAALLGQEISTEIEFILPQQGARRIALTLSPEAPTDSQEAGVLSVESDITDLKQAEDAFFRREREFQTIVENSPDIIARVDGDARHWYINRSVEAPFGLAPVKFIGRTLAELQFPDNVSKAYAKAAADVFALNTERAFNFSMTVAGKTRHYTARAIPELDPSGAVESALVVTYDVTQRTEAQLERDALLIREKAARMQAERAARARDEFLAIVSHELRSPLNGIQSWTHVLENYVGVDSAPVVRALAGIKLGVQQQVRLIEDLLDATLAMTGKLKLTRQPVDLAGVISSTLETLRAAAEEKKLTVAIAPIPESALVDGDQMRIQQIIWNLLSNAIKFTPSEGRIDLEVSQAEGEVKIVVRDTGRGIAAEFLPFLFDPFRQADGSSTRRTGGIGLGLTLVRRLTELHAGRVTAHSRGENMGAEFTVYLPAAVGMAEPRTGTKTVKAHGEQSLSSLRNRHIVLVDDQPEARDSLAELLDHAGAVVAAFASGVDVVEHFRAIAALERPDVLICDIAMPEQDGYVTLQKIREVERARPREGRGEIPAIALTAFSQREDKIRALANGFQVHLAKPVDPAELISVIEALSRGAAGENEPD